MSQLIPEGLHIPPGVDARQFLLSLPALGADQIPDGADIVMTTDGPDQVWFLVVAIICITVPGLFLILRVYTRLVIMRCLEPADCECDSSELLFALIVGRLLVLGFCMVNLRVIKFGVLTLYSL